MPNKEKKKFFQKSANTSEIAQKLGSNVASTKEKIGKLASEAASAARNPSDKESRKRLPTFISAGLAFLVGLLVDGAIGLVLAVIVGILVLWYFKQLKIPFSRPKALLSFLLAPVGRLMILLGLLLPFGNGLTLATGHYPDTLMKYLSIVITLPQNLLATSGKNWWFGMPDYYPGAPLIVSISIVLMFIGALRIQKTKFLKYFIAGLILYTISPSISYLITTGKIAALFYSGFYAIGYFVTWAGLILFLASKYLGKTVAGQLPSLHTPAFKLPTFRRGSSILLSSGVLAFGISALNHFIQVFSGTPLPIVGDAFFEVFHHGIASVGSGFVAGAAAAGFIGGVDWSGGSIAPGAEEAGIETVAESVPSAEDEGFPPPGSTVHKNPDGTIEIIMPDGSRAIKKPDGTKELIMPDGEKATLYSDGTIHHELPDGSSYTEYPDGTKKSYFPDGSSGTLYPDGRVSWTDPNGITRTWDKDGKIESVSKYYDGDHMFSGFTFVSKPNDDGSYTSLLIDSFGNEAKVNTEVLESESDAYTALANSIEGTLKNNNGGIINGTKGKFTYTEGDSTTTLTSNDEGWELKFSDKEGNQFYTNSQGALRGETKEGRFDIDSDGNGTIEVYGKAKYTGFADGSFKFEDKEGTFEGYKDGSGRYTGKDGTKATWTQDKYTETRTDGTIIEVTENTLHIATPDGTSASATINKDGSVTVVGLDGSKVTYSPEEAASKFGLVKGAERGEIGVSNGQ